MITEAATIDYLLRVTVGEEHGREAADSMIPHMRSIYERYKFAAHRDRVVISNR